MNFKKNIFLIVLFIPLNCFNQEIKVNQVGYLPGNPKLADVPDSETGNFKVINVYTGEVKYTASLSDAMTWPSTQQSIRIADFSALNDTGTYRIEITGSSAKSDTFRIGNDVYLSLCHDALHYYYLDRASTDILPEYAGIYARKMGHPDDHVIVHASAASEARPEGTVISTPGGWYDAGDYNKYLVSSGIATYTVFAIAEDFPGFTAKMDNNIPESSNNVPDIIDEGVYNLRWMLSMQDPDDGGVYHKCTTKKFEDFVAPKDAVQSRYVVMKTVTATLNLAAIAAQASRILRKYGSTYPGLADSCLNAAEYAYQWAKDHPAQYYIQPDDIHTGSYGDDDSSDEFRWAAMELYTTTHNEKYLLDNDPLYIDAYIPGWYGVYPLGLISMMRNAKNLTGAADIHTVRQKLIAVADQFYNDYMNSAYRVPATSFYWGSNGNVANGGMMSLQAYAITHDHKYIDAAAAALDYLLGRNPTGYCYVTGYGTKSPMHPHDRKSASDGIAAPIPGMLVGGANPKNTDDCGSSRYPSLIPALSYYDNICSYSTNEIAINLNAPLAYLACGLEALQMNDNAAMSFKK